MRGRAVAAAVLCIAVQAGVPSTAEEASIFEDPYAWDHPEAVQVSEQELLFNDPRTGGFKSRSFYFTGYVNDEIHFEISVFQWEYSLFGGWGLQVLLADSRGKLFVLEERIPEREIRIAEDRFSIRFGGNELEGLGGDYRVSLDLAQFRCDLHFESQVPPWRPGNGYAYLNEERSVYIRVGVAAPLARVRGFLSLEGRHRAVQGWGYADRSLIIAPINRMNSPTYAFRGFSPCGAGEPGWMVSLLRYESHRDFGPVAIPFLLLIEGKSWVLSSKVFSFSAGAFVEDPGMPVAYPCRLEVHAVGEAVGDSGGEAGGNTGSGKVRLDGAFVGTTLIHYSDIFEEIPEFFRAIVEVFFHRPIIFRVLGSFHGTVTFPDGTVRTLHLPGHGEYTVIQ